MNGPRTHRRPSLRARLALEPAVWIGTAWVLCRRRRYRRASRPLLPGERALLLPHFSAPLLDAARVAKVERIADAPLARLLRRLGVGVIHDLTTVAGMAFVDTVVIAGANAPKDEPGRLRLIFHELVHVAQWRELGVPGFLRAYLDGWLGAGRSYRGNPLEVQAFELEERFARNPAGERWSVEEAVRAASCPRRAASPCVRPGYRGS